MDDQADGERCERDGADGEQQDAADVALEFVPHGEVRAVHQEWRQEHDQDQFGIEIDGRQSRYEGHRRPAYQKRRSGRQPQPPGEQFEADHRGERQQDEFEGHDGGHAGASMGGEGWRVSFYHTRVFLPAGEPSAIPLSVIADGRR